MTSRSSALRKSNVQRKSAPANSKAASTKAAPKPGKLPEWNLADLYSGIDAPEVARDLAKMDADCVAFETDYKGKLAEFTARDDGGSLKGLLVCGCGVGEFVSQNCTGMRPMV